MPIDHPPNNTVRQQDIMDQEDDDFSAALLAQAEFGRRVAPIFQKLPRAHNNPQAAYEALTALQSVIEGTPDLAAPACWSHVLPPLANILDSLATLRRLQLNPDSDLPLDREPHVVFPAVESHRVTEAALRCTCALLHKSVQYGEADLIHQLLSPLIVCTMIPANHLTEEARLYVCQCLCALMPVDPTAYETRRPDAAYKATGLVQQMMDVTRQTLKSSPDLDMSKVLVDPLDMAAVTRGHHAVRQELQDPLRVPALGQLINSLSRTASMEAAVLANPDLANNAHGYPGSRDVCVASLQALRGVLTAVSCGDRLRFFMPGIVRTTTWVIKELMSTPLASGSIATALTTAVHTMTDTLLFTLSDSELAAAGVTEHMLTEARKRPTQPPVATTTASDAASDSLQRLQQSIQRLTLHPPGKDSQHSTASTTTTVFDADSCQQAGEVIQRTDASTPPVTQAAGLVPQAQQEAASSTESSAAGPTHQPDDSLTIPLMTESLEELEQQSDLLREIEAMTLDGSDDAQRGAQPDFPAAVINSVMPEPPAAEAGVVVGAPEDVTATAADAEQGAETQPLHDLLVAKSRQMFQGLTVDWVVEAESKLVECWERGLFKLVSYPKPSVRAAVAQGACQLLTQCSVALSEEARGKLLDMVLALAQDPAPQVARHALEFLSPATQSTPSTEPAPQSSSNSDTSSQQAAPELITQPASVPGVTPGISPVRVPAGLLSQLVQGLWPAIRGGGQQALLHVRKLVSAFQLAGVEGVATQVLPHPTLLSTLLVALVRAYQYEEGKAAQVLTAKGLLGAAGTRYTTTSSASIQHTGHAAAGSSTATSTSAPASTAAPTSTLATPSIPRMPLLSQYLTTAAMYEAVATVARLLGWSASQADVQRVDGHQQHLIRVREVLVGCITDATQHAPPDGTQRGRRGHRGHQQAQTRGTSRGAGSDSGEDEGSVSNIGQGSLSWQNQTAAAVAVAAEVLLGAGPGCWTPPNMQADSTQAPSTHLGLFASRLVDCTLKNPSLVGLPTTQRRLGEVVEGDRTVALERVTLKELGDNALVLRSLLDLASTVARTLGTQLTPPPPTRRGTAPLTNFLNRATTFQPAALLRPLLVTAVERSADSCNAVAAAASDTLACLAVYGGYTTDQAVGGYREALRRLLAANADYVVDAVRTQLRDLTAHPRAPMLLAALLGSGGGVAPALLPVMADPLAAALQGVSILSRHSSPQYVHSFVSVLNEVSKGAQEAGEGAAAEAKTAQDAIKERVDRLREEREAAFTAAATTAASRSGQTGAGGAEEARAYFMARAAARGGQTPGVTTDSNTGSTAQAPGAGDGEDDEGWLRGVMTCEDLQKCDLRFRSLHSAAVAAGAVVTAAAPLLVSQDLKVAVTAVHAVTAALSALAHTTPALDVDKQLAEDLAPRGLIRPVQPESPKLGLSVACVWPYLTQALTSPRTPLVEESLVLMSHVIRVAGGAMMARKFSTEVAPLLGTLLARGSAAPFASSPRNPTPLLTGSTAPTHTSAGAGDSAEAAEGALVRVRVAALGCVAAVCSCQGAWSAVKGHTWGLAQGCLPFLASTHPAPLRHAAMTALKAVALVDADSVWLLLTDLESTCEAMPTATPHAAALGAHAGHTSATSCGFPPLQQLLPLPDWSKPSPRTAPSTSQSAGTRRLSGTARAATGRREGSSSGSAPPLPPSRCLTSQTLPWPVTQAVVSQCCAEDIRALLHEMEGATSAFLRAVPLVPVEE